MRLRRHDGTEGSDIDRKGAQRRDTTFVVLEHGDGLTVMGPNDVSHFLGQICFYFSLSFLITDIL